jgi:hypothetical protein
MDLWKFGIIMPCYDPPLESLLNYFVFSHVFVMFRKKFGDHILTQECDLQTSNLFSDWKLCVISKLM